MAHKHMALVGFMQAQNCSNYPASWRHPHAAQNFLTAEYYQHVAKALEAGKFHMLFFDDRLAMPDIYGADHRASIEHGIRVVKMDPIPILATIGAVTSHIGLGGTLSTSYFEPFHIARQFSTLDHMTGGRAAWNVVTSLNDSEAMNMGAAESIPHDLRYDRSDEFMEVVLGHWNSWGKDALLLDRKTGKFADPDQVSRLEHDGEFFKSRGPFTVPQTPQGHPVVIQAGQSGRGREFAVRWGEVIFAIFPNLDFGKKVYAEMRDEADRQNRDPDSYRLCPLIYPIVAETQSEAEDKLALIESLAEPIDTLTLLSEALNFDFATKDMDDAFSDDELANLSGLLAVRDRVLKLSGKSNPTVADFVNFSARGTIKEAPNFVGTPAQVADGLEQWFTERACDGFVIGASHIPGTYEDFSRLVVPELQKRGLHHKDYVSDTLRKNLGFGGYRQALR
ncbi:MAG: LLM class flavin-dependent oxidoreductase [Gammaproteobacteria bacterium]